jgi:TsgA-like MFS transporter
MNRIRLIAICIIAAFLMSGFVNPIGLISEPVSLAFGISITSAVSAFGYFTVGVFAGYVISFYIFDYLSFRVVVIAGYLLLAAGIAFLYLVSTTFSLSIVLFCLGTLASVEGCGAGTLISVNWQGRPRQVMLIAQDAMFNGGGIVFTTLTTWFIASEFHWASTYSVVGILAIILVGVSVVTNLEPTKEQTEDSGALTHWNPGIILVGVSMAMFMTAKISIFIWAPQFAVEKFDADIISSGNLLTNVFIGAFTGSLIGTWLVSKIRIAYFLIMMLTIGTTGMWLLLSAPDLESALLMAYLVGASVGATYNGYTAFALTFVTQPTHKHIAYILTTGGIGSALAPWISSAGVEMFGSIADTLFACFVLQLLVLTNVVLLSFYHSRLSHRQHA